MPDGQQTDKWAEAGFPNVKFHPIMQASKALYDALFERHSFIPETFYTEEPRLFANIPRINLAPHREWNATFNHDLYVTLDYFYNERKWGGKLPEHYERDSFSWHWHDMQEFIADNTQWHLSDFQIYDIHIQPRIPTENWANARREALQQCKYLYGASSISGTVQSEYHVEFQAGQTIPSLNEQWALLQNAAERRTTISRQPPAFTVVFQKPGRIVDSTTSFSAYVVHSPGFGDLASGRNVLLKYNLGSEVLSGQTIVSEDTVWISNVYQQHKNEYEALFRCDRSGIASDFNGLGNVQIVNIDSLPQENLTIRQRMKPSKDSSVFATYYAAWMVDVSDSFVYPSYDLN